MRTAARRDKNEPEIVKALLRVGCHVQRNSDTGVPDLTVTLPGGAPVLYMEVKSLKGKLSPAEAKWWADYGEVCGVIRSAYIVRSIDCALALVEAHRRF